jgi:hypothetical protein
VNITWQTLMTNNILRVNLKGRNHTEGTVDEEENQIDATKYFIELVIGSTCFGHHYVHCNELETTLLITK